MPHANKIPRRFPEGTDLGCPADGGRALSGSPAARGPCFQFRVFSIMVTVFVLIAFLLPGTVLAARLAEEEPPAATAPAGLPPATAGTQPAVAVQTAPPVSPSQAVPQMEAADTAGVGAAATPEKEIKEIPAEIMPPSPAVEQRGGQAVAETPLEKAAGGQVAPPPKLPPPPQAPGVKEATRYVTIDFDNVDISVFIKFVSELTGKNFVVDDKVKGKVTVISPKKIALDEVYKVFESVLEIYGFATVQAGEVTKVILAQDARGKRLDLLLNKEAVPPEDRIVTRILSLDHSSSDEMKKVLDPLISKTSIILSYPPTGMLIITDVISNIQRLEKIVTALDVEGVGELISYIPLKFASAADMVKPLASVFQQSGRRTVAPIKIVADDRSNALIILATENDTARIRELLDLMDKEIPKGAGTIRVYYLQNAKAEDLVKVLTGLAQPSKTTTGAPGTAAAAVSTAAFSKNVQIMADKATNSLIITADKADYSVIEEVIRKLDITRAMVYLEALIMEVNANKSFNVGVEWSMLNNMSIGAVTDLGGQSVGIAGFNTGSSLIPQATASGVSSLQSGFSLGVIGAGIKIGGVLFPNIGAVLNAYQNDADVRILSTPQLLTLDNEDAEITVGENVPYVSRQDTSVGSLTNYSNYEYKDVGVTLKVTPQINRDGYVRMKLDQTVTKVVSQSASVDAAGSKVLTPTTLKRTAKTTVVVKSGETVVIGGMIQDDTDQGISKVPLLGDIPLLGWLFKSRSSSGTRTNLFVFLSPRIIQTPEDAGKIKEEKMDYMRTLQEGTIKNTPVRKRGSKENKEKEKEKN